MKKQGFTLIELMVVIVIMGILAAVAVPKLFGQIAKSKASEVATNASAYKTAVDAYVVGANTISDASTMGYTLPGEVSNSTGSTGNFKYYTTNSGSTWVAAADVGLNDCAKGSTWSLVASYDGSTGATSYSYSVSNTGSAGASACLGLTSGFEKLGSASGT